MFFMMGITDGRKDLDFSQQMICNVCGRYGRYQVFMTYTVLSLFFIPCFRWNKHYYVLGSTAGRQDFGFHQQIICDICRRYGRFQVFMTYTVLSLFFIPCFKWNKHYYVQTSCCNTVYELDAEIGKRIAAGEDMEILPQHLRQMNQQGYGYTMRHCRNCGFSTTEDFEYCPKCGTRLSE